jgi:hypothetical protein
MSCSQCDTAITGHFETTIFARLSPESLAFIELFVRHRGNIKEMERELGLPYNAVRNRLDEVIGELGFDKPATLPPRGTDQRSKGHHKTILARLEKGEITPAQAVAQLEKPHDKGGPQ